MNESTFREAMNRAIDSRVSNLETGIKAENMIAEKLLFRNQDIEQNHTWGIDIILQL